jgi:Na+-transporting NADH:ubiquinone oxidoreductase subunit C
VQFSTRYIFTFAAALCLACSTVIALAAVSLRPAQERNKVLDMKRSVLLACAILKPEESVTAAEIESRFSSIEQHVIELSTGAYVEGVDANAFDDASAPRVAAPANDAQIKDLPTQVKVYQVQKDGKTEMYVLPIYGKGLWSTLYGYIALDADTRTVRGLTYYQHGETPGLGGEVDNPIWKALWPGRKVYDENFEDVKLTVVKGQAGPVQDDPYHVDGLSGATITSRGVTNMVHFWFGDNGYGPFLAQVRERGSA